MVSDSWCFGVSPAQEANCAGRRKRVMSPISATNTAASTGPIPSMAWIAVQPGSLRTRVATSLANSSTSNSSAVTSRSAESTRARSAGDSRALTSNWWPSRPNRSLIGTATPAPTSTPWI